MAELAILTVALGGLYFVSNKNKHDPKPMNESFVSSSNNNELPNTNILDRNYPPEAPIRNLETDITSSLAVNNAYDGPNAYTDKYFNPNKNSNVVNPYAPSNNNSLNLSSGTTTNKPASYYSMTGEKVDSTYFQHNNMVPFFGSKIRNMHADSASNESTLDAMNGSGSQYISKREQAPLFTPHNNMQWANGTPNTSEFVQSRMNIGNRMAGVKPFEPQQVGPGLGLGYTTEGQGGFNAGTAMRDAWMDRGVDELRVASKPKSSEHMLLGHEGPAMSKVVNYGEIGRVEKNRPDTMYENTPDRWFTTTGREKGHTLRPIENDRNTNRQTTGTEYTGVAKYAEGEATYIPGEYMPSTNIELGAVPIGVANANGRSYANEGDYNVQSIHNYKNNRSENNQDTYFGSVGGAIGAVVAPLLDALRPSRKENAIGNIRPYQNPKTVVPNSYIFNPADRPATTIRETTERSKNHLQVNANQHGNGYISTPHQVAHTYRSYVRNENYVGNASAYNNEARVYDAEYNQRNNEMKEPTLDGYMVKGNMNLFNGNMNVRSKEKSEMLYNDRDIVPSVRGNIPNMNGLGEVTSKNGLYQNVQLDRNTPDILSALNSNPYVVRKNYA